MLMKHLDVTVIKLADDDTFVRRFSEITVGIKYECCKWGWNRSRIIILYQPPLQSLHTYHCLIYTGSTRPLQWQALVRKFPPASKLILTALCNVICGSMEVAFWPYNQTWENGQTRGHCPRQILVKLWQFGHFSTISEFLDNFWKFN